MKSIFFLLDSIITIYLWIIIINAILSWLVAFNVLNTQNKFVFSVLDVTYKLTDPALNKIRRFIPTFGSIDISPVILILLLIFLRNLIFEKDTNGQIDRRCPVCKSGVLSLKNSFRGGAFIGCSNYPECKFTRPLSKSKAAQQNALSEPILIGKHDNGNEIFLKNGRFGPYLQYEIIQDDIDNEIKKKKKSKMKQNINIKNISIPKGMSIESINLEKAKYLCSLPKNLGTHPDLKKDITLNIGRFGPYLKCDNKSAQIESAEDIFSIGLNRAITLISDAKPGRVHSSMIKNLGEHPNDKKPVRVMKGKFGPYLKYKSLNTTIPEEKDPNEITMEEALILIEKRKEYDRNKRKKR